MHICIKAYVYMDGRYPCYFTTTRTCYLRVSSTPAHCDSSPEITGNPRLPAHSEGGSWKQSSIVEVATLTTYSILSNLVCSLKMRKPGFRGGVSVNLFPDF